MIEVKLTFKTLREYFWFIQTLPNTHTIPLFSMPGWSEQFQQLYRENKELAQEIMDELQRIRDLRAQAEKETCHEERTSKPSSCGCHCGPDSASETQS